MNEIAIIEFESFQENIALEDTALNSRKPKLLAQKEGEVGMWSEEKKDGGEMFIVEARKNCLSQS